MSTSVRSLLPRGPTWHKEGSEQVGDHGPSHRHDGGGGGRAAGGSSPRARALVGARVGHLGGLQAAHLEGLALLKGLET